MLIMLLLQSNIQLAKNLSKLHKTDLKHYLKKFIKNILKTIKKLLNNEFSLN